MNPLLEVAARYQTGNNPVFPLGPFLPILLMREKGLRFEKVLKYADDMASAALLNLDLGFETTMVPYDMNVEAEIIGCRVNYHQEMEGNPVYPTIGARWIETADDFQVPEDVAQLGRMPQITEAVRLIKERANGRGAVGVFVLGPFTLAGQVLDPDRMFVTVLKQPEVIKGVLEKLTVLIAKVRDAYVEAGADFVVIEEGGAGSISPKSFETLVLAELKKLFGNKAAPHILSFTGKSEKYIRCLLEAGPDGIGVDQGCDLVQVVDALPHRFPLLAICGANDMLAFASPEEVRAAARDGLGQGVTMVSPPADVYPPARLDNIMAFVDELRTYRR